MNQSTTASGPVNDRFTRWVQSFFYENVEQLFGQAISDFGADEVRSHLAELADWSAHRITRGVQPEEIQGFLDAARDNWDIGDLRKRAQAQPAWAQILVCLTQEAPLHYHGEILPQYGQGSEEVGASSGSGASR
jgi:hypothetical protein